VSAQRLGIDVECDFAPARTVPQAEEDRQGTSETAPAKPQLIEIPSIEHSTAAQKALPTISVLANGERLETERFVLTASKLSVTVDRHERTIPADMLDINATIAANRERQINLSIPVDRNEISLSF
jgi:hypothetical protein